MRCLCRCFVVVCLCLIWCLCSVFGVCVLVCVVCDLVFV